MAVKHWVMCIVGLHNALCEAAVTDEPWTGNYVPFMDPDLVIPLQSKRVIKPASLSSCFHSSLCLCFQGSRECIPAIDISTLNAFVYCCGFTMDMPR